MTSIHTYPRVPYNGAASLGLEPGPAQSCAARGRRRPHQGAARADPGNNAPVPTDLVTASASGLDPHISVAAAQYQVARVAKARAMAPDAVQALVAQNTEGRTFGMWGPAYVEHDHYVRVHMRHLRQSSRMIRRSRPTC